MSKQFQNRRLKPVRRSTKVKARLDVGWGEVPITIVDFTDVGMKIEVSEKLKAGSGVRIGIRAESTLAIVAWCHQSHAGLYLLEKIDAVSMSILEGAHV